MSTLYIRLPSKATADSAQQGSALACPFALVSDGGAIEREGVAALSSLSEVVIKAKRVLLLLAASDVTLLRVKVPPLSAPRLKAALPHLVEDQLMSDPAECVVVAGAVSEGLRTVAVVHRAWLEFLAKTLIDLGARNIAALPTQLCLPHQAGTVSAAIVEQGADIDLTVRLSEQEGIGLPIMPEQHESAVQDALQALRDVVLKMPEAPIALYVPPASVRACQDVLDTAGDARITVVADHWSHWIAGANNLSLNLMPGLGVGSSFDGRPWRWPLALAAALLAVNLAGLNIDWWRMKREADSLRAAMTQTFKSTYPKEAVIVDPVAQMRQKIAAAERDAGQLAPDDFMALAAAFGEAWANLAQGPQGSKMVASGIAALEYRERSLIVRLKAAGAAPTEEMKLALAARNLSLSEPAAGVWQIRSAR